MISIHNYDHLLFVYGTLRMGQPNHYLLRSADFLDTEVVENYRMFSLGSYPGVQALDGAFIVGEVYGITNEQLALCDRLEAYPDLYSRTLVPFRGHMAWMYVYNVDSRNVESIITGMQDNYSVADWVKYRDERTKQYA